MTPCEEVAEATDIALETSGARVAGRVAAGFESVAEAFADNFSRRGEVGAAFAACQEGRMVVDLWGGLAGPTTGSEWRQDTVLPIFSGSKGLLGICLLLLIDRGALDLDERVCRYWPEFGTDGKQDISVRELVSHQAGLPGIRRPLTESDILNERLMVRFLEREAPFAACAGRLCYHPLTFGWLCSELIRRIDGRGVGHFFADEIARPLDLELWFGLPLAAEPRVATLVPGEGWDAGPPRTLSTADPELIAALDNPPRRLAPPFQHNGTAFRNAGVPGTGAIGSARAIARLYGCLVCDREPDDRPLVSPALVARGRECLSRGRDAITNNPLAFGIGFELQTELMPLGPAPAAFGHTGAGGSAHGAWPAERVGFSYAMNEVRDEFPDPRAQALLRALHDAVGRV